MWALVTRLGGQRRIAIGAGGAIMLGWDMGAAFELSRALGLPDWLVAEWLPAIESAAVAATNEGAEGNE